MFDQLVSAGMISEVISSAAPTERERDEQDLLAPPSRVARVAGSRNLADFAIVDMVADVLISVEWAVAGINSEFHWLEWQLGITRQHAGRLVAVAKRRDDLVSAFKAFAEGMFSLDQMSLICRHCPTGYDEGVVEVAKHATIPQLRHILRAYPFPEPDLDGSSSDNGASDLDRTAGNDADNLADGETGNLIGDAGAGDLNETDSEAETDDSAGGNSDDRSTESDCDGETEAAHQDELPTGLQGDDASKPYRGFGYGFDEDGSFRMWLRCGADDGAEIAAALDQVRAWRRAETGEFDISGFESFLTMVRAGVDADPSETRGLDNRVVVHLDHRDLDLWTQGLRPSLHLGPILRDQAMELLSCDGSVQVVKYQFGRPVSLGRSQRVVPSSLRRIILHRDNGCRFPGCSSQRWLDVHHIVHWTAGGATDSDNLVCLCRRHHKEHHRGHVGIKGDPEISMKSGGRLTFFDRNKNKIVRPDPIPVGPPKGDYEHASGESYDKSLIYFGRNRKPAGHKPNECDCDCDCDCDQVSSVGHKPGGSADEFVERCELIAHDQHIDTRTIHNPDTVNQNTGKQVSDNQIVDNRDTGDRDSTDPNTENEASGGQTIYYRDPEKLDTAGRSVDDSTANDESPADVIRPSADQQNEASDAGSSSAPDLADDTPPTWSPLDD